MDSAGAQFDPKNLSGLPGIELPNSGGSFANMFIVYNGIPTVSRNSRIELHH